MGASRTLRPTPGLVSREVGGLPTVPYYAAHLPDRAGDRRTTDLLTAIRTHLERMTATP